MIHDTYFVLAFFFAMPGKEDELVAGHRDNILHSMARDITKLRVRKILMPLSVHVILCDT